MRQYVGRIFFTSKHKASLNSPSIFIWTVNRATFTSRLVASGIVTLSFINLGYAGVRDSQMRKVKAFAKQCHLV